MNFSFSIFRFSLPFSRPAGGRKAGFSLVEISMVLLLFATAIGGLLSFFPVGLRLENNAISDSAQTMFALNILSQVEANAAAITAWDTWKDPQKFRKEVFKDISINGKKKNLGTLSEWKGRDTPYDTADGEKTEKIWRTDEITEKSYLTSRSSIRYVLQVAPVETPIYFGNASASGRPALGYRMYRVAVWVSDRRDGDPYLNTPFMVNLIFQPDYKSIVGEGKI